MDTSLIGQLILQVILIACNAFFACAEIAVLSVNEAKLNQLAENGDRRAIRLRQLTNQPARFLATIQVAITLSGFLGSAFAADNFSEYLVHWLLGLGLPVAPSILDTVSVVLITLILSFFTLVFGELVPKRIAMKKAEALSLRISTIIAIISTVFAPIVWILTVSTNATLRLFGIDPNANDSEVSEEDIQLLVDEGQQKGVIDEEETRMIRNVFRFDDIPVREFATHRTEVTLLWVEDSMEEWEQIIHRVPHSHFPVCGENADDIIGVLNTRDYFLLSEKTRENVMAHAVKPAWFTPQTVHADVLFRQMKQLRRTFAIVLDEYGGMYGVVSMNDLLSQIVGDLDSIDGSSPEIRQMDETTWEILGSASLCNVIEALQLSREPSEEYDTFNGLIFDLYGSIPQDGTELTLLLEDYRIHGTEIRNHKVVKATVTYCPPAAPEPDEE